MGNVGEVVIHTSDQASGKSLHQRVKDWLIETGWNDLVSVSSRASSNSSFVELRPGVFQSNGPRKIKINTVESSFDFLEDLRSWLYDVQ